MYNTTTYMFRKNLFGDITAIYRGNTKVAEYRYDAWGNCVVVDPATGLANTSIEFIGNQNPFRYRGYYWDNDLQLYYLMSRYYDPATGRFINADSLEYLDPETIGGLNLYAYCCNNPIMGIDPLGTSSSFWNYIKREFDEWWANTVRQWNELPQDIADTITAFGNNFVLEAGVGFGFGGSIGICDGLSIGADVYVNPIHLLISGDLQDGVAIGMKNHISVSFPILELFVPQLTFVDEFKSYSGEKVDNSNSASFFWGVSASAYLFIGGSFSAGFDIVNLWYDLKEIWR